MKYFLENKKVGLRLLEKSDIDGNYANWFNDEIVCRGNSHHRFPISNSELEKYVEYVASSKTSLVLAIIDLNSDIHIGNISLQNIDYIDRNAEIAYIIGEKKYWGGHFATEASKLLISHAFFELGMERIYCATSSNNSRMQGLAEKLNFKKEGIRRKAMYKAGEFHDIIEFGLLKEEWGIDNI